MKITVNDCLSLDAFSGGILIGGKRNTDNRVRSVSVMDAQDAETAIEHCGKREQLVLTSFYGMENNPDMQKQVVEGLAQRGASALAVFHVAKKSPFSTSYFGFSDILVTAIIAVIFPIALTLF